MDVVCPRCRSKLPESAIDAERFVARCPRCRAVFPAEDQIRGYPVALHMVRPFGITIEEDAPPAARAEGGYRGDTPPRGALRITRPWLGGGGSALMLLGFVASLGGGALTAWAMASTLGTGGGIGFSFVYVPMLLVLAWGAYWMLALAVNRWVIAVDGTTVSVRHGPLPWPPRRSVVLAGARGIAPDDVAPGSVSVVVDGQSIELVREIPSAEARYVAWLVGDRLGTREHSG